MFYEMTIAGCKRQLPLCPVNDELYIAACIMFNDVEVTRAAAKELLAKAPEFDVVRQAWNKDYVVCRKGFKLYMRNVIETSVDSITTDHLQKLCIDQDDVETLKGRRVLIVDDVVSTGESLNSIEALLKQIDLTIVGRMCVLAEGEAAARGDITYLNELPVFNPDGTVKE